MKTLLLNKPYKGWSVLSPTNPWLTLRIVPELGGRIMQIALGDYEFLFINPALEGRKPGKNGLSEQGTWLNFGGEKIWPAPQGWDSPDQWPGPPDPVLDSGDYTVLNRDEEPTNSVRLLSPIDAYTGLQIERTIAVSENRSEVIIDATFINKSQQMREWSIWPVIQMNTPDLLTKERYQVVCPVNPVSQFENGYKVLHGLVNNPQFAKNDSGNLTVTYQYLIGKIGLDSTAGWVAFCDRQAGKVLVAAYQPQLEANYPDGTPVQVWTQGRGMLYSRNQITEFPNNVAQNPPYLEMELLGPLQPLQPNQQSHFTYRLLACTIPENTTALDVHGNGVVAEPLTVDNKEGTLRIRGKFGLFISGEVELQLIDAEGHILPILKNYRWSVSPLKGFTVDCLLANEPVKTLQKLSIKLVLFDQYGSYVDILAQQDYDPINQ
jgi:hypothetical protein